MATRTTPQPPASAPPSPPVPLAPPECGRHAQDAPDPRADVLASPRTLSLRLDDPAAAALSLRTHMQPADLMELVVILAEAAADVLRERDRKMV
ncbi:MAG: hypothetical protein LC749_09930 [Actinobacteria bacterium]|nr:hypothetical protein [Actinomycetota bacterium]